ncbi:uncharacterized protein LOC109806812 isoform X2 [Cajanus cajan]|uniref:uncharacterized protein LOC109806812 isoform X2 n=1 Tax=Cajanus cajan TaxID=3821 RepID=UPI00098D84AD|nr:uncharacterized protein LOC109806812 isoform X2 [Cajanus cajan]
MKGANLFNLFRFSASNSISRFTLTADYSKFKFASIRTLLKPNNLQLSLSPLQLAANYLRTSRLYAGDALVGDHESQDVSEEEENVHHWWRLARKFWLPVFFFLTVLTNLDDSITILFIKLTLFLLSTKPNPFSVYVFVDQLCQQFMRQETRFLKVKSLYASKVEVQDYKLLCLADVEVRDQKFTLVGILGSWWTLPHLPFWEALSYVRNRIESILVKTT